MSKHRLDRRRRPGKLQCKSTPHRLSLQQIQRRQWAGQMGGIGVAAMVIAIPLLVGVDAVAGFPIDLASPPSSPTGQRPLGPSWLPGVGAGLHTSGPAFNPLFKSGVLDGSVASSPEVLHTALSLTLPSSNQPAGFWVGGRWVSADPVVRPTEPCPSPVLDPAGWLAWWHRYFPGVTPPALPPAAPPAAPATPPSVPVVVPVASPVESVPAPLPAVPSPAQTQPVQVDTPVMEVSPVTVDPPSVDLPPVVVDLPVLPPVEVDVPPIDLPPISVPPVDVSPITDPVTTVTDPVVDSLPEPVGDAVDGVTSVLSAPTDVPSQDAKTGATEEVAPLVGAIDSVAAPVAGSESTRAGAELPSTKLGTTATTHSTSGNGEYVGKHRADSKLDGARGWLNPRAVSSDRRGVARAGRGESGVRSDRPSRSLKGEDRVSDRSESHRGSDSSRGRHRVTDSHSKSESHSKSGGKSHSDSKSHDGGSKSHDGGSHGGSHGGGHRG